MTSIGLYIVMLLVGILINIFIGKLVMIVFKRDGTIPRLPIRFLGVYLIINSLSNLFHI